MKKMMLVMAASALAAVVAASAQEVLSANAVGYVRRTIPAGKLATVAIPFVDMNSTNVGVEFGTTTIAQEAPQDSEVMFWNETAQVWNQGAKGPKGWAGAQSNYVVKPGEGFFMKNNSTTDFEVTASGEVPGDESLARAYAGASALSVLANPYPVDFNFGTSTLAAELPQDSEVMFWNETAQVWNQGAKGPKGWAGAQSNTFVSAGEGFFIRMPGDGSTWTQVKPYTWP